MKIQRLMFKENLRAAGLVTLLGLASCAIDNDIPYPLVEGTISEIVTEGLRASEDGTVASGVDIDRSARTVTLYVNDSVDVSRLRLTRLILDPRDATIELDSARCDDKEKFPFHDFASLDSLSLSANTRLDLSTPLELNVRTYQDNPWTRLTLVGPMDVSRPILLPCATLPIRRLFMRLVPARRYGRNGKW